VVLRQYTYEPYGAVVFADENGAAGLPPLPNNRLGHQGLFFERLYVDPNDSLLEQALSPGAVGLYNNKARWLHPNLGRFLQRDMNETALLVQAGMAMNGRTGGWASGPSAFDPQGHYGDGMNLYQYVGSNPANRRDPRGLFSLAELGITMGEGSELRSQDAVRTGIAAALLTAMLGAMFVEMQWQVGGGMSASSFDAFVEGTEETIAGNFARGEYLMLRAELAVFITANNAATKVAASLAAVVSEHAGKILAAPGGPNDPYFKDWTDHIRKALNNIDKELKGMNRVTGPLWRGYINAVRQWLTNPFGGPPPVAPA
jgi:hypothetical protein